MQRPRPKEACDIGTWLRILEIVSYLAVATNAAIIVWTSQELNQYSSDSDKTSKITLYDKLIIGLILEHAILIIKFMLSEFIPDAPGWVREAAARKSYFKQLILEDVINHNKLKRSTGGKPQNQEQEEALVDLEEEME